MLPIVRFHRLDQNSASEALRYGASKCGLIGSPTNLMMGTAVRSIKTPRNAYTRKAATQQELMSGVSAQILLIASSRACKGAKADARTGCGKIASMSIVDESVYYSSATSGSTATLFQATSSNWSASSHMLHLIR